jgi:hypothetical protein
LDEPDRVSLLCAVAVVVAVTDGNERRRRGQDGGKRVRGCVSFKTHSYSVQIAENQRKQI